MTNVEKSDTTVSVVYKDTLSVPSFFEFNLPIIMQAGYQVSAITLGLYFPEEYLEIKGMMPSNGMTGYSYNITDSLFKLVWSNVSPINITDGDTLITLQMRSLEMDGLSGTIKAGIYELSEFADQSANAIEGVVLEIPEIAYQVPDPEDSLSGNYVDVYPNPFKDFTTVNFYLEQESTVRISICNLAGIEIDLYEEKIYPEGTHQVIIDGIELAKGVYLLKFEIDNPETKASRLIKLLSIK